MIAYGLTDFEALEEDRVFTLTKKIPSGLPLFEPPIFYYTPNGTDTVISFGELVRHLGSGIVVIPIMALLESIAIASGFGKDLLQCVYKICRK